MHKVAHNQGVDVGEVRKLVAMLHEANPMMGHRGCRLAITYPEILAMQVRAIVEAAIECASNRIKAVPEIMIPLVGTHQELRILREQAEQVIADVRKEKGFKRKLDIKIGTMIEIPRAALTANEIAEHADFFSFGTNDLTQTTMAISRDDAEAGFLLGYLADRVLEANPFATIDAKGVGRLMGLAVTDVRRTDPSIEVGICGEHGGEPASIALCHELGLDYVSCSAYRVPVARLAAAHAALA